MSSECQKLHELFNNLSRFKFPIDFKKIPLNGIYVLFERGESAHGFDRIVRIGTHTGDNLLRSRLRQHFITENKDGSIFRKNIGRTILNIKRNPYLKIWNLVMTTKESVAEYGHLINKNYQKSIEKEVSEYIQNNFSFCVLEINDKNQRITLESKIISTVAQCNECKPSESWFGLESPIEKIKYSGLWLVNELHKKPVAETDIDEIKEFINFSNDGHLEARLKENFTKEKNISPKTGNKIWVNINRPTKKCTLHTNLSCPYVLAIKETNRKGIEDLKRDGGWKSFSGYIEAMDYCKEWKENKDFSVTTCC